MGVCSQQYVLSNYSNNYVGPSHVRPVAILFASIFCPRQYVHWYGSAENCANPVRSVFADIPILNAVC